MAVTTNHGQEEFDALPSVDMRNTMVVVLSDHVTDGSSVSQLQALTFGGLVRRLEAAVSAQDGTGGANCNGGVEHSNEHAAGLKRLLQEMREEGGESFEEVAHMCGSDVRNSLIVELWSRTHVEVAGLQALDDEQLLVRGRELLRQGVLPKG